MQLNDVVVLGGGPAGAAVAIALCLNSPLSVLVVESSDYNAPRIGETLSPGTQGLLRYLNVWDQFSSDGHQPSYGTAATWGSSALHVRDFLFSPFGTGWHLDRQRFDRMMADAAVNAGASLWINTRMMSIEPRHNQAWRLRIKQGSETIEVEARYVVDATGKSARFARSAGRRPSILDRLVGVARVIRLSQEAPQDAVTLVEAVENGWWYSVKLPGNSIAVSFMSDSDIVRKERSYVDQVWQDALSRTEHTRSRVDGGICETPLQIYLAHSAFLEDPVGDGWLAVGDAAASYDPLSSSGIPKALYSGILGADAILGVLRRNTEAGATRYRIHCAESLRLYRETRTQYYRMERRWPNSPFWTRRH